MDIQHVNATNGEDNSFRILFHENPTPMWIFDTSSLRFLEVNQAAVKEYGYTHDEFLNMTITDIRPVEDISTVQHVVNTIKGNQTNKVEYRHILKDGDLIHVEITSFAINYKGYNARIVQANNISERLLASKVTKTITDNAMTALFMLDKNGLCTYANPSAEKIFGYRIDEISTGTLHSLFHYQYPDGRPFPQEDCPLYLAVTNYIELKGHEDVFYRKDGTPVNVLCAVNPIFEDGKPVSTVVELLDITEQKRLEAEQLKAQQAIESLMLKKDEFMSIASHELKTPLTSIKAYTQLLQKNSDPTQKAATFINKTLHHINKLEHLIIELLDVTRINSGKLIYNITEFDFDEMLRSSVESVQHTSLDYNIIIEQSAQVQCKGDRLRLEQVINNFLTNAVKYSPDNKQVIIRSVIKQDHLVVSVQDFGIGIAKENQPHLFDRFYRVDSTAMQYQGLGLGLFIAENIIKRHNGNLWLESELDKGSTFYFSIPLSNTAAITSENMDESLFINS